ncbi:hypothetical protein C7B82_19745 [Stenomitos frigidus ULC18]|uniref:Uncharacterized protein n=1 Tax=Stenomitos frigidus ULC18 TaxID=2107698 RepID=A0A2T1E1L0_9CYAN|nr:hypothetical protein C7B82_19745 [Stenomitos frigidus ULC18]
MKATIAIVQELPRLPPSMKWFWCGRQHKGLVMGREMRLNLCDSSASTKGFPFVILVKFFTKNR